MMKRSKFNIRWIDSSCPFDDSDTGQLYKKVTDELVEKLVNSLLDKDDHNLRFGFVSSEFKDEKVRCFVILDNVGNEIANSCHGVDDQLFKKNIVDKCVNENPVVYEIFKYRSFLSEPSLGFKEKPLDEKNPDYEMVCSFIRLLDVNKVLNEYVVRYVFQKIMRKVVDEYETYTIVNP